MADLKPLIRHRQHIVDEKQRFLAELYRQEEALQAEKKALEDQIAEEVRLARESEDIRTQAYLSTYLEGARQKKDALDERIEQMNVRIASAREDVRLAFAEMKKIEITQRKREEEEDAAIRKKEDSELDEIGLEVYRRQQEEESNRGS